MVDSPEIVCTVCKAAALPRSDDLPYEGALCGDCGGLMGPRFDDPPEPPSIEIVRAVHLVRRALRATRFAPDDFLTEGQVKRALLAQLQRSTRLSTQPFKIKFSGVTGPSSVPDGRLEFHRHQSLAIEVKVLNPIGYSTEIARGLGQCLTYCEGDHFPSGRTYAASVLVAVERRTSGEDETHVRNIFCVRGRGSFMFWVYHLHRVCIVS